MLKRAFEAIGDRKSPSRGPWYREPAVWLVIAAILVPFGWLPLVCRYAWGYAVARRDRQRATGTADAGAGHDATGRS
jgi:hypothetical protein